MQAIPKVSDGHVQLSVEDAREIAGHLRLLCEFLSVTRSDNTQPEFAAFALETAAVLKREKK